MIRFLETTILLTGLALLTGTIKPEALSLISLLDRSQDTIGMFELLPLMLETVKDELIPRGSIYN
jgi:hypothetical protein